MATARSQRFEKRQNRAISEEPKYRKPYGKILKSETFEYKYEGPSMHQCKMYKAPKSYMKLMTIFSMLHHYHNYFGTVPAICTYKDKEFDTDMGLRVSIQIGGEDIVFVMMPGRKRQVFIKFDQPIDSTIGHSYDDIVKLLDEGTEEEIKQRAQIILNVIDKKPNQHVNWKDNYPDLMNDRQREAARQLLVLTHVAEPALPEKTWAHIDLTQYFKQQNTSPKDIDGGIGGIDAFARVILRKIQNGQINFHKGFNSNDGEFIPARKEGKRKAKNQIYIPNKAMEGVQVFSENVDLMSVQNTQSSLDTLPTPSSSLES